MKIQKLTREQKKMWNTIKFLLRLMVFSVPLYIMLWLNLSLLPLQNMIADQITWILAAFGFAVTKNNLILSVGTENPFIFFIGPDCTGWKSMLAFVALIFATMDTGKRKRLFGLVFGIPLIYLGNLFRIVLVVFIERGFGLEAALFFHDWLWQAGLIALVLCLWLVWLKWEKAGPFLLSIGNNMKNTVRTIKPLKTGAR